MAAIDVHSHFLEEESIRALSGDIVQAKKKDHFTVKVLGKSISSIRKGFFNIQERKLDMDAMDITTQVISPTHHLFCYSSPIDTAEKTAMIQNDGIARACRKEPDILLGNAILPLQDTRSSIKELERAYSELEMKGIEIGTNIAGKNLDEESLFPVYERIQELGMPLFIHPSDFHEMGSRMEKYHLGPVIGTVAETTAAVSSMIYGRVFETFPKLKAVFCHGGGSIPFQLGRLERAVEVWEESYNSKIGAREALEGVFFDTVLYDDQALNFLLRQMGTNNIVLGTDYPFSLCDPDSVKKILSNVYLRGEEKEQLLFSNPKSLYRL